MSGPVFESLRRPGLQAFVRPEERPWFEALLEGNPSVYEAAPRAGDVLVLHGRAPVFAVPSPRGRRVVRRYHRGGAMASLLGDRHLRLGRPRPVREAEVSEAARRRGVPTPRVVAGATYPAGLFYRADLVTAYVPGSVELAAVALEDHAADGFDPVEALAATGRLLALMASVGVRHVDFNAKNVLLTHGDDMPRAHLLDLDRCRVTTRPVRVDPRGMLARLERSLAKLAGQVGRAVPAGGLRALRDAAVADPPAPEPGTRDA